MNDPAPRAPEGDWLGTPYLRFERRGPIGVVTVDRPEARNAMTPAMYFGVRYAVDHVNADPDLAGLLITGTGDVFIPGGDLGGENSDGWADLPRLLGMDNTPVRRDPQLPQAGGVRGERHRPRRRPDDRDAGRCHGGQRPCVVPIARIVPGIADTNYGQILPRQIGPAAPATCC